MIDRETQIRRFLEENGFDRALRAPLAGDASARRYERLRGGPCPAILMDAPPYPPGLRTGPFVQIATWLRREGFSPPSIIDSDVGKGLVLMEDLGTDLFSSMLASGSGTDCDIAEADLYAAAVEVLLVLQDLAPPPDLPAYDDEKMLEEVSRFTRWYAPRLSEAAKADYLAIWRELLPLARVGPPAFVYVDYHADNLIWLPEREGLARVGLLDFQDGRLGPPAYDLVSLLEDARRDVGPDVTEAMIERYLAARPALDHEGFRTAYAVLGAQRNCKILGLFSKLAIEDGKTQYLAFQDRVRSHLQHDLAHPNLVELATWFDGHVALNIAS